MWRQWRWAGGMAAPAFGCTCRPAAPSTGAACGRASDGQRLAWVESEGLIRSIRMCSSGGCEERECVQCRCSGEAGAVVCWQGIHPQRWHQANDLKGTLGAGQHACRVAAWWGWLGGGEHTGSYAGWAQTGFHRMSETCTARGERRWAVGREAGCSMLVVGHPVAVRAGWVDGGCRPPDDRSADNLYAAAAECGPVGCTTRQCSVENGHAAL